MSSVLDRLTDSADVFVDPTLFGVAATYTPAGETASTSINVTFSEPGVIEKPQSIDGETTQPAALARSVDVASAKYGDKLVISGTTYRVTAAVPDGSGLTTLWLTTTAAMQVPYAPTGLTDTYTAPGSSVPLTWTNADTYDAIEVWRAAEGADAARLITLAGNATSHTDTGLTDGPWRYTVRALNASGPGAFSNERSVEVST
jgi:hypothetical protein